MRRYIAVKKKGRQYGRDSPMRFYYTIIQAPLIYWRKFLN